MGVYVFILRLVGGLTLTGFLYSMFLILRDVFGPSLFARLGWTIDLRRYGDWAVVTGGSSGIGLALAKEVARRGLNVLLISRSVEKLENAKSDILSVAPDVEVRVLSLDLSETDWQPSVEPALRCAIEGLDIALLINNAAAFVGNPSYLDKSLEKLGAEGFLALNCLAPTNMLKLILPHYKAKAKGIIVNINSSSSFFPIPKLLLYSSSKSYLSFLSEGLAAELEFEYPDIICQSVCPFYIKTEMIRDIAPLSPKFQGIRKRIHKHMVVPPDQFARQWIHTVGWMSTTSGTVGHNLWGSLVKLTPRFINLAGTRAAMSKNEQSLCFSEPLVNFHGSPGCC